MNISGLMAVIFLIITMIKFKQLVAPAQQHAGTDASVRRFSTGEQISTIIAALLLTFGFAVVSWEDQRGAPISEHIDLALICFIAGGMIWMGSTLISHVNGESTPTEPDDQITYRSISPIEITPAADHRVPALNAELETLGFRFLGPMEVKGVINGRLEAEVTDVFASPDGSAFAEPERFFSADVLDFRTLFNDGTIIETALMRVDPKMSKRGTAKMWPRTNLPRAGYLVDLRTSGAVWEVWEAHRTRVSEHMRSSGHAPLAHQAPALYFQLCRQALELAMQRKGVEILLTLISSIIVVLIVIFSSLLDVGPNILTLNLSLLLLLGTLLATIIARGQKLVVRQLNRSQLRTLARLLG